MSDRLALANAIEDAGIERGKAERVASVIIDAIHDNVASKQDLQLVETALKADLLALESRLTERFTRRGITGLIAAGGILFAALHMWPPHTQLALNSPASVATVSTDGNGPDYNKDGTLTIDGLNRLLPPAPKPSH